MQFLSFFIPLASTKLLFLFVHTSTTKEYYVANQCSSKVYYPYTDSHSGIKKTYNVPLLYAKTTVSTWYVDYSNIEMYVTIDNLDSVGSEFHKFFSALSKVYWFIEETKSQEICSNMQWMVGDLGVVFHSKITYIGKVICSF